MLLVICFVQAILACSAEGTLSLTARMVLDFTIDSILTAEVIFKVLDVGAFASGPNAYLRSTSCIFDFCVLLAGFICKSLPRVCLPRQHHCDCLSGCFSVVLQTTSSC